MKNTKKVLAVALCGLMMTSTATWAGTDYDCEQTKPKTFEVGMYRVKDSLKMRLLMEKKAGQRVMVRLLDQRGQVLHEEMVGKRMRKYGRNFDFSQIKDGRYTIEVSDGSEVVQKTVNLSSPKVQETPKRTLVAGN